MSCTRQPERADTKDAPLDSSLSPTSTTNKTLLFSGRAPTPRCAATRRTVARRHDIDFSSPCTLICLNLTTHSPAYPLQRRARAAPAGRPGTHCPTCPSTWQRAYRSRSQRCAAVVVAGRQASASVKPAGEQAPSRSDQHSLGRSVSASIRPHHDSRHPDIRRASARPLARRQAKKDDLSLSVNLYICQACIYIQTVQQIDTRVHNGGEQAKSRHAGR
ncbi:hypothetical protein IWX90DRAFT_31620 [Phyllosticta citrichinensis]|uniref:Uncharacterized protein n=1 Tax=Phyllosticta citrichinensis TaxID=1130410 RepID=A0ABR1Y7P9_9PEZI